MRSTPIELFNGRLFTCFGQCYVVSPDHIETMLLGVSYVDQVNGLCGGAAPGGLFLTIGLHTGKVRIRVELLQAAPPTDLWWDEIVEASCTFADGPVYLQGWERDSAELAMLDGVYRARFCARAFGETDDRSPGADSEEAYLLILWPEAWRPDQIIKQTSERVGYWHQARSRRVP